MIVVNKTKEKIHSHHRRGVFLHPGSNDIDESALTKSEREMIFALAKHKIVEIVDPPPESGTKAIPTAEPSDHRPIKMRRAKASSDATPKKRSRKNA